MGLPKTAAAYLAGILDGEGCVAVRKSGYLQRRTGKRVYYLHASVVIVNTYRPVLALFRKFFGGHLRPRTKIAGRQQTYSLTVADFKAATLLTSLLPYLRIKKRQAVLTLRCQQMNTRRATQKSKVAVRRKQTELFYAVKRLKKGRV